MRLRVFTVYDKKAEEHRGVYCEKTRAAGVRSFTMAVLKGGSLLSQYPEDYQLRELGTFDPLTGRIDAYLDPVPVAEAAAVIREARERAMEQQEEQLEIEQQLHVMSNGDEETVHG